MFLKPPPRSSPTQLKIGSYVPKDYGVAAIAFFSPFLPASWMDFVRKALWNLKSLQNHRCFFETFVPLGFMCQQLGFATWKCLEKSSNNTIPNGGGAFKWWFTIPCDPNPSKITEKNKSKTSWVVRRLKGIGSSTLLRSQPQGPSPEDTNFGLQNQPSLWMGISNSNSNWGFRNHSS